MATKKSNVVVVGAGVFGASIAYQISQNSNSVTLIDNNEQIITYINDKHAHPYWPDIPFPDNITAKVDPSFVSSADILFLSIPSALIPDLCKTIQNFNLNSDCDIIILSKGLCVVNRIHVKTMVDIVHQYFPHNDVYAAHGASFADEVIQNIPTHLSIGGTNFSRAKYLANTLSSENLHFIPTEGYIGLCVAGALKNVAAIACGVVSGYYKGKKCDNATSVIATLAIEDIKEASKILGEENDLSLSSIADIIMTCNSSESRNRVFGEHLAKGKKLIDWRGGLVEGATASENAFLLKNYSGGESLKLLPHVFRIIRGDETIEEFISDILKNKINP